MNLTQQELNEMVDAMQECDEFLLGPPEGYENDESDDSLGELSTNHSSIEIEIEDSRDQYADIDDNELYDGQPTEYEEWQDVYGGDDWDHGQYDDGDYYDGGTDF